MCIFVLERCFIVVLFVSLFLLQFSVAFWFLLVFTYLLLLFLKHPKQINFLTLNILTLLTHAGDDFDEFNAIEEQGK